MPKSTVFTCTKCSLEGSSSVLRGVFLYKHKGETVSVKKDVGICNDCDTISPVEVLPNPSHLKRQNLPDIFREKDKKRIKLLKNRNSPARCLKCGGHDHETLPNIELSRNTLTPFSTGIKHKHCGGHIYADISEANIKYRNNLQERYYSIEGILISSS